MWVQRVRRWRGNSSILEMVHCCGFQPGFCCYLAILSQLHSKTSLRKRKSTGHSALVEVIQEMEKKNRRERGGIGGSLRKRQEEWEGEARRRETGTRGRERQEKAFFFFKVSILLLDKSLTKANFTRTYTEKGRARQAGCLYFRLNWWHLLYKRHPYKWNIHCL